MQNIISSVELSNLTSDWIVLLEILHVRTPLIYLLKHIVVSTTIYTSVHYYTLNHLFICTSFQNFKKNWIVLEFIHVNTKLFNIIELDLFLDKNCYDEVKKKKAFISTPELTTIMNNMSSTQIATNRSYISYSESTTTGSNNITRQNDVTTNNDKEYVINIWFIIFIYLFIIFKMISPYEYMHHKCQQFSNCIVQYAKTGQYSCLKIQKQRTDCTWCYRESWHNYPILSYILHSTSNIYYQEVLSYFILRHLIHI